MFAALALLLVAPLTGLASNATAQQTDGDQQIDQGPVLRVLSEQSDYAPGERVQIVLNNTGDQVAQGTFELSIWQQRTCPDAHLGDEPCGVPVHQRSLTVTSVAAGAWLRVAWNRTMDDGQAAPGGSYWAQVHWTDEQGHTQEFGTATFELITEAPKTGDTGPSIDVLSPRGGASYPEGPVRIHVVYEAADGLAGVQLYLDGRPLVNETSLHTMRFAYDHSIALTRGAHDLRTVVVDADGDVARQGVAFFVQAQDAPAQLSVRTDHGLYEPSETVRITVRNNGQTNLSGTPGLEVRNAAGTVVWSPVMAQAGVQVVETLGPGEERTFLWDQRHNDGHRVRGGTYTVHATWGQAHARGVFAITSHVGDFTVHLVEPEPGAGYTDEVPITLQIGAPGASALALTIANGETAFDRRQSFPEPMTGRVRHTVDLSGVPPGAYRATIKASGPGGTAQAQTWFRVLPQADTTAPVLTVDHPSAGQEVHRVFPVVFHVADDVGIRYAEVYLANQLIGRQAWPVPVQRGAVGAHVPADLSGDQRLRVVAYDAGHHRDAATLPVHVLSEARPCVQVLMDVRALASAGFPGANGSAPSTTPTSPLASNASLEAGMRFECPGQAPGTGTGTPVRRGAYDYRVTDGGLVDVEVRGQRVFDRVAVQDGPTGRDAFDLQTRGRFLVVSSSTQHNVTYDLNGSWVAIKRGQHVLLENTADGSRLLLVLLDGRPNVLGQRVVAELPAGAKLVVRPLGDGPAADRLADAIVQGRIGAEVAVGHDDEAETVSYGDLDVTVARDRSRVEATLSSPTHDGRTLVFTLDENASMGDTLEVLLDGEPVQPAASLADVLDQADPALPSEYFVVQADGETLVVIQVNHFSTRELVIQAAAVVGGFLTPLAVVGGLGIVGVAAAALLRREPT